MSCNDDQIYPRMWQKVKEEGMGIREAARWVEEDSEGAVTEARARNVYFSRSPVLDKTPRQRSQKKVWNTILTVS